MLLGSKAPNRNVEQHDFFFGIARNLPELVPAMRAFWPEAGNSLHLDGWREVCKVGAHEIRVLPKEDITLSGTAKLFFINLGGYQTGKLEEQHYTLLSVHDERSRAVQDAKKTIFFKTNTLKGAGSHIDEKYGIDVDDIYAIEDILAPAFKARYQIQLIPAVAEMAEDQIHLGYFKLDKLK